MKILITGASGFAGRHLVKHISKQHSVFTLSRNGILYHIWERYFKNIISHYQCDLTQSRDVKIILDYLQPDVIIHFAGNPHSKLDDLNPSEIIRDNIIGTQNLCHYAKEDCHIIFASSVLVYGDMLNADEKTICSPTNLYGATKLASEHILSAYKTLRNIKYTALRMCALVGKDVTHGILFDFIKKVKMDGDGFPILGTAPGSNKPFCHIEDIIGIVDLCIHKPIYGCYNVLPKDTLTAEEIGKIILSIYQSNKTINWLGENSTWKGDTKQIICSNDKLNSIYQMKYTSKQAMEKAIKESLND